MAYPSKGAKSFGPSFYDYINGLRGEFELLSNPTSTKCSRPSRFNVYLAPLQGEFELMSVEIKSLRKEGAGYEAKVEEQAKELQKIRGNRFCERCSQETTSISQTVAPFLEKTMKATFSLFSRPFFQSESLDKLGKSDTLRAGDSSPLSEMSTSTADPEQSDWSIEFNNEVKKELDVEMARVLFHGNLVEHLKFSRDGQYLAAGCRDGTTYIYDVESGTLTCVLKNLLAKQDHIFRVCFSHDGRYLATISSVEGLLIWDIKRKHVRNAFKGHGRLISSLDFSPNGRLLVTASYDNTVRLWSMRYGAVKVLVDEHPDTSHYLSVIFSPDGKCVAATNYDGMVRIWDICTGLLMRRLKSDTEGAFCLGVVFMPDGKGLFGLCSRNALQFWDVSDATNFLARSQTVDDPRRPSEQAFLDDCGPVSFSISPSGRWVASASQDQIVFISDTRSRALQCTLNHGHSVVTVDFSPSGHYLASGGEDGIVRIWRYLNIGDS